MPLSMFKVIRIMTLLVVSCLIEEPSWASVLAAQKSEVVSFESQALAARPLAACQAGWSSIRLSFVWQFRSLQRNFRRHWQSSQHQDFGKIPPGTSQVTIDWLEKRQVPVRKLLHRPDINHAFDSADILELAIEVIQRRFKAYEAKVTSLRVPSEEEQGWRGYIMFRPDYARFLVPALQNERPLNRKRILDVGSGPGYVQILFRVLGKSIEGLDPNPKSVELARSQGLNTHQGNLMDPPAHLLEKPYDITFAITVFKWLQDKNGERTRSARLKGLQQLARLTASGGLAILYQYTPIFDFTTEEILATGFKEVETRFNRANFLLLRRLSA